jgi:hypothetical protein
MGILDFFRGRKEEPEEKHDDVLHSIPLEGLPGWIDEQFSAETEEAMERISDIRSRMADHFSETRRNFLEIQKSAIEGDDKVSAIVNMTKDSYVKHSLSLADRLRLPETGTWSDFKKANSRVRSIIKEINSVTPKQAVLLGKYFTNESSRSAESLRKTEDASKELREFLDSGGRILEMSERLKKNVEQIGMLLKQSESLKTDENSIRSEINNLDLSKKEEARKLEILTENSEWKKLSASEEMIRESREELGRLEAGANEVLNAAKRPLKKLIHVTGSRESFPDNPFEEYVLGNREDVFIRMLEDAGTKASEGEITLKPKENEKLLMVIDYVKREVPSVKKRHVLLTDASRNARNMIKESHVYEEKSLMEKEIGNIENGLKSKWSELDSLMRERKRLESDIAQLKKESERLVLDHGKKLEIRL